METADRRKLSNAILTISRLLAAAKMSELLNRGKIDGLKTGERDIVGSFVHGATRGGGSGLLSIEFP
jgi:hypothetical protein